MVPLQVEKESSREHNLEGLESLLETWRSAATYLTGLPPATVTHARQSDKMHISDSLNFLHSQVD